VDFASIVLAILGIGVLIVIHELGHYLAAKWAGMRVSRFSIGFGPVLYKTGSRGETEFVVSAIPFGGYVAIDGMSPEDPADTSDTGSYHSKSTFAKFGTIVAGPAANYVLGFVLFFAFFAFMYAKPVPPVEIQTVQPDSPAQQGGLKEGDAIVGVDGERFGELRQFVQAIEGSKGEAIRFDVERDGERRVVEVTPEPVAGSYFIGVNYRPRDREFAPMGVVQGFQVAWRTVGESSYGVLKSLAALFGGQVGLNAVDGPLGIVKDLSGQVKASSAASVAYLARLSIVIGFFNLLPIPALDGGRLMFLLVAWVRRKPIEPRFEGLIHFAGFALLLTLIAVVSVSDVFE
jgi:regulator of sigma E protease